MTVKELIDRLHNFPFDAEVNVADGPFAAPYPAYECCQDDQGRVVIEAKGAKSL